MKVKTNFAGGRAEGRKRDGISSVPQYFRRDAHQRYSDAHGATIFRAWRRGIAYRVCAARSAPLGGHSARAIYRRAGEKQHLYAAGRARRAQAKTAGVAARGVRRHRKMSPFLFSGVFARRAGAVEKHLSNSVTSPGSRRCGGSGRREIMP